MVEIATRQRSSSKLVIQDESVAYLTRIREFCVMAAREISVLFFVEVWEKVSSNCHLNEWYRRAVETRIPVAFSPDVNNISFGVYCAF